MEEFIVYLLRILVPGAVVLLASGMVEPSWKKTVCIMLAAVVLERIATAWGIFSYYDVVLEPIGWVGMYVAFGTILGLIVGIVGGKETEMQGHLFPELPYINRACAMFICTIFYPIGIAAYWIVVMGVILM